MSGKSSRREQVSRQRLAADGGVCGRSCGSVRRSSPTAASAATSCQRVQSRDDNANSCPGRSLTPRLLHLITCGLVHGPAVGLCGELTCRRRRCGRLQTPLFLRPTYCAGDHKCARQAADPEWHIFLHHEKLPILPNGRKGMAGLCFLPPFSHLTLFFLTAEFDSAQFVTQSVLCKSAPFTRRTRKRVILED